MAADHTPAFCAVDPFDDSALDKISLEFPFWIKPVKCYGSALGFKIDDADDFADAIEHDVGVDLSMIGLIIAAAALFDAFTDPLIGYGSDRYRTRFGRRKTWLAGGIPLLALAFLMLLNPPLTSGVAYLAFWYLFLRVGSTMVTIPYAAWGAELSVDLRNLNRLGTANRPNASCQRV